MLWVSCCRWQCNLHVLSYLNEIQRLQQVKQLKIMMERGKKQQLAGLLVLMRRYSTSANWLESMQNGVWSIVSLRQSVINKDGCRPCQMNQQRGGRGLATSSRGLPIVHSCSVSRYSHSQPILSLQVPTVPMPEAVAVSIKKDEYT